MKNQIKTSVIGSYPIKPDSKQLINDYYNEKQSSWKKYIKEAVDELVNSGMDIVSDGQTRDPMVQIFTRKLKGCRIRNRTEIVGKVVFDRPITVDDQKYVKDLLPKNKELLGIITGPYTLANSCIDLYYNNEKELSFDFALALKKEAEILQKHVDIISIDEPFFSNNIPDYGKVLIQKITENISCPTRLHVCGDVSKIIPDLLEMPVDILSHEFKASPHLFESFKKYSISKKICLGSVRSDNAKVETVEEIVTHIQKGIDIFDGKLVHVAPDCGQRFLPRNVAFQKLKNLVRAGEMIYG